MKIIGLSGSPRKEGNTDILLQQALAGAKSQGAATGLFYLNDLSLRGCQACGGCKKTGRCVVQDDMQQIYQAINDADAVIIGSPIYFGRFTAQLALVMDRLYAYIKPDSTSSLAKGKRYGLIISQGNPDAEGYAACYGSLAKNLDRIGFEQGCKTLVGAGLHALGDATRNQQFLQQAFNVGMELAAK